MNKSINKTNNITIIGTGAWGTAIAKVLSESGNNVTMYGINNKEISEINKYGTNKKYFGNNKINKIIKATSNLELAISKAQYIVLAIPSIFLKETLIKINKKLKSKVILINLVKGIDSKTKKPWSITIKQILNDNLIGLASLIGPSFAIDVFKKKYTSVNLVSDSNKILKKVSQLFYVNYFKLTIIKDEIGSEIIASYKNLLAIGIGIIYSKHKSINTLAAVFAQGVKEIDKISINNGGDPKTILEFCGIGDIFLTCYSNKSRNFNFGQIVYKKGIKKALSSNKNTVEGYSLFKIINKDILKNKELPLFTSICLVLNGKLSAKKLIDNYFELIK